MNHTLAPSRFYVTNHFYKIQAFVNLVCTNTSQFEEL